MATQRTLSIIKARCHPPQPHWRDQQALRGKRIGHRRPARRVRLTEAQARAFYAVHKERSFYDDLCAYMTSARWWFRCSRARTRSRPIARSWAPPTRPTPPPAPSARNSASRFEANSAARLGFAGKRGHRDRLLLRGDRYRRLSLRLAWPVPRARPPCYSAGQHAWRTRGVVCNVGSTENRSARRRFRGHHQVPQRRPRSPLCSRSCC